MIRSGTPATVGVAVGASVGGSVGGLVGVAVAAGESVRSAVGRGALERLGRGVGEAIGAALSVIEGGTMSAVALGSTPGDSETTLVRGVEIAELAASEGSELTAGALVMQPDAIATTAAASATRPALTVSMVFAPDDFTYRTPLGQSPRRRDNSRATLPRPR